MGAFVLSKFIAAILGLAGLSVLVLAAVELFRSKTSGRWSFAEATIIESAVEVVHDDGRFYQLRISYRYAVDGETFIGKGLRGEITLWSWSWLANRMAKRYPVGTTVRAYYPPFQPGKSVLEPGTSLGRVVSLAVVGGLLLVNAWNQLNTVGL